jgi:hypothetical protein
MLYLPFILFGKANNNWIRDIIQRLGLAPTGYLASPDTGKSGDCMKLNYSHRAIEPADWIRDNVEFVGRYGKEVTIITSVRLIRIS